MSHKRTRLAWAAAILALALSAGNAAADVQSPLVGFWSCSGQANGVNYVSTFNYRPDGTYLSTQHISAGASSIQGGGGGVWRFENGILSDTKQRATLDRFVRDGVEVPSSDPEWQELYRQSQANLGVTTSGPIRLEGDVAYSGMYTCHCRL
jgi:hypothetical protein